MSISIVNYYRYIAASAGTYISFSYEITTGNKLVVLTSFESTGTLTLARYNGVDLVSAGDGAYTGSSYGNARQYIQYMDEGDLPGSGTYILSTYLSSAVAANIFVLELSGVADGVYSYDTDIKTSTAALLCESISTGFGGSWIIGGAIDTNPSASFSTGTYGETEIDDWSAPAWRSAVLYKEDNSPTNPSYTRFSRTSGQYAAMCAAAFSPKGAGKNKILLADTF